MNKMKTQAGSRLRNDVKRTQRLSAQQTPPSPRPFLLYSLRGASLPHSTEYLAFRASAGQRQKCKDPGQLLGSILRPADYKLCDHRQLPEPSRSPFREDLLHRESRGPRELIHATCLELGLAQGGPCLYLHNHDSYNYYSMR